MKISILCISVQKHWWEETKQNIYWVFSFSPNPKLEKSSFFKWKIRVFASTFCAHDNVKKYLLQRESNSAKGLRIYWEVSFL